MDSANILQMRYYSINPTLRRAIHRVLPQQAKRATVRLFLSKEYNRLQQRRSLQGKFSYKPFDELKCIFVHIPKTGGTSITKSLFKRPSGGHAGIWQYQLVFNAFEFDSYFKFAFVRNPWDRLHSAYEFVRRRGESVVDKDWCRRNIAQHGDFGEFVKRFVNKKSIYSDAHILFIPQYEFICLDGSSPIVDFVGRFETIERDFNFVRAKLGVECELHKKNVGPTKDYKDFYTEETKQIVADAYREDIEIFGYSFENAQ